MERPRGWTGWWEGGLHEEVGEDSAEQLRDTNRNSRTRKHEETTPTAQRPESRGFKCVVAVVPKETLISADVLPLLTAF